MMFPAAWQPHTFTLPCPCCFSIPLWSAFCPQGSLTAAVSRLSSGCAGSIGWRAVPASAVFSCLKYSKIKNWMSWIQHEDGLLPSLKLVPGWFACPVKSKKTELPLNSLDKTQWHLCLCIWSFKVLWVQVAVLQCSLDFSSVLYCVVEVKPWFIQTPCRQKCYSPASVWCSIQWLGSPISLRFWAVIPLSGMLQKLWTPVVQKWTIPFQRQRTLS